MEERKIRTTESIVLADIQCFRTVLFLTILLQCRIILPDTYCIIKWKHPYTIMLIYEEKTEQMEFKEQAQFKDD